jgi:hypothetical protein
MKFRTFMIKFAFCFGSTLHHVPVRDSEVNEVKSF